MFTKARHNTLINTPYRLSQRLLGGVNVSVLFAATAVMGSMVIGTSLILSVRRFRQLHQLNLRITHAWLTFNKHLIETLPPIQWHVTLPHTSAWIKTIYSQATIKAGWILWSHNKLGLNHFPFTRFFTKWELIYIPFIGLCFKFLDFPMIETAQ